MSKHRKSTKDASINCQGFVLEPSPGSGDSVPFICRNLEKQTADRHSKKPITYCYVTELETCHICLHITLASVPKKEKARLSYFNSKFQSVH